MASEDHRQSNAAADSGKSPTSEEATPATDGGTAPADRAASASALDWNHVEPGGDVSFRQKRLADAAGGETLGCSLYELPPEHGAWPYHYHAAVEEAIYVLDGSGIVRTPDGQVPVSAGDYVALPRGEAGAHRVVNDGDETLRYLCLSADRETDVLVYPDSGKVRASTPEFDTILDDGAERDYWDGEV